MEDVDCKCEVRDEFASGNEEEKGYYAVFDISVCPVIER